MSDEADGDDVEAMLDKCEERDEDLNDYERKFIDECQTIVANVPLGFWRLEKLTQIYNRIKDNG